VEGGGDLRTFGRFRHRCREKSFCPPLGVKTNKVRWSALETGACGLPYYCTPPACVPDVIVGLVVWRHNNQKKPKKTAYAYEIQGLFRECRSIRSGFCGLPYYCAPLVCVPDVTGVLFSCVPALQTKNKTKKVEQTNKGRYFANRAEKKSRGHSNNKLYGNRKILQSERSSVGEVGAEGMVTNLPNCCPT